MSSLTIYVYEKETGKIQYTVEDAQDHQVENFKKKHIPFFATTGRYKTLGTYVKIDANTGSAISIEPIQYMDFISINKSVLVANGTDEVVISGLTPGIFVDVNGEGSYVTSPVSGTTLELSANGYSYVPGHNRMTIKFRAYGYHDSQTHVDLIEGE